MLIKPNHIPGPNIDAMAKVNDGARIAHMLPDMEREIGSLMHTVETRMYQAIANGSLTPEAAVTAWHEMAAYRNLLKRYQTRVKVGESVAETHKRSFTIGE